MPDKEKIWDPLRRKEVPLTPEERVRQWFVGVLCDSCGVPMHMMMTEVSMKTLSGKRQRADIVVYSRSGAPVVIVECKRPDVSLGQDVAEQAVRYNNVLDVRYLIITNGHGTYVFAKVDGVFSAVDSLPVWEDIS